jgi:hypothetical protein
MNLFHKKTEEQTTHSLPIPIEAEGVVTASPTTDTHSQETSALVKTKQRNEKQLVRSMVALIATITTTIFATIYMGSRRIPEPEWFNRWFPPVMFTLGILSSLQMAWNIHRRQRWGSRLVAELAATKEIEAVPHLIDILSNDCTDDRGRLQAYGVLTELLPKIQPDDATHFKAHHLRHINSLLMRLVAFDMGEAPPHMPLRTAIVRALAHIGDENSLKYLHRLDNLRPNLNPQSNEFYQVVEEVIPVLEVRVERLKEHQTLLRASSEPVNSDMLLRPASGGSQEPAQELLRTLDTEP